MPTLTGRYLSNLRTEAQHVQSGSLVETDAPTDNNGNGERFSPTDTVALALGSCMVTVMAIEARKQGVDFEGMTWEVTKEMASNPRRINRLTIKIEWPNAPDDLKLVERLKQIGIHCPVALSLHPDLEQVIEFGF